MSGRARVAGVAVLAGCLCGGITGCSSTHYSQFVQSGSLYDANGSILGLPIVPHGVAAGQDGIPGMENSIDQGLSKLWSQRYVPISKMREDHGAQVDQLARALSSSIDPALVLRVNADLCRQIAAASGCDYAVLPRYTKCSMPTATVLQVAYVIPLGIVWFFGTVPISLGVYPDSEMPAYTLSLIDLKAGRVMADEAYVHKGEITPGNEEYPAKLIDEIEDIERQLSKGREP